MKIIVNDKPQTLPEIMALEKLLDYLKIDSQGCAIAVNKNIVPKNHWPDVAVFEGDNVAIFKAISGG